MVPDTRRKSRAATRRCYLKHRKQRLAYAAAYRAANREKLQKRRASPQWKAYMRAYCGLPEPTRPRPKRCEGCARPPQKKSLCLDHDHLTGKFRGWLCTRCNLAAAMLADDPRLCLKLAAYLRK